MAHGKNYRNAKSLFDREHEYSPVEAVRLLKEMQTAKFDETVEVHFRLGLNVRHADEQVRGTLMLHFDVAIATPDQMGNVGKLGRILGPRGLMPNPKTGTVTMDVAKAVRDAKAGKLEYRTDRGACVHVAIGKKSFDQRQLVENYAALLDEIVKAKPAAAKGRYIRQITLATTMSPGIRVDTARTRGIVEELEESQQEAVPA
ncbi:MAG: 50S ribosomal protein L1 [Actinobacteria bacterium]|nr:MAG: 50S ribosomal protein L1 [Actinomycetota bacterium]